ncbi:transposable element Tcb1 transposase [Trichonephila clavipes]|nr:transposable element Tcb1 transposase [Trichonephila clavipes]
MIRISAQTNIPSACGATSNCYLRLRDFDDFKFGNCVFSCGFLVVFTNESRICLRHHDGRIRNWRHRGERMLNSCVMHRHTGPAPGIMVLGGIGYHFCTPLVRIAVTLNSQRYISEMLGQLSFLTFRDWSQPYFNNIMHDHTWHALSKGSSSITKLNCFPSQLALWIFR